MGHRSLRLDALRGFAIFLVLGRHLEMNKLWLRVGWLGVDLFFVLSGFLISGLLFSEYAKTGEIKLLRFWARRAFRIYPPFLIMIAVSEIAERLVFGHGYGKNQIISELTWTQNYRYAMWAQTWSLAVEEHFYIVLPLFLIFLARKRSAPPFGGLPAALAAIAVVELILRIVTTLLVPEYHSRTHGFPTHLRVDSLLFGVLIGYLYHFRRIDLERLITSKRKLLMAGVVCCLLPAAIWEQESPFMRTAGFTLSYIAFGQLLMLNLPAAGGSFALFLQPLAAVGRWSYSIYLWHAFVLKQIPGLSHRLFGTHQVPSHWVAFAYIGGSIFAGWLTNILIELPAIRLRDRLIPQRVTPAAPKATLAAKGI